MLWQKWCGDRENTQRGQFTPQLGRKATGGRLHDAFVAAISAELAERIGNGLLAVVEREVDAHDLAPQRARASARL